MLAPFMDDLDDNGKEPFEDINENCAYDEGEPFQDYNFNNIWDYGEDFNVYSYYDEFNNRLIIQWDNVSNGEDDENCPDCVKETFQLVLLDQDYHSNNVNQGDIVFLYEEINDIDENGNFSTIGIESPDQNFGTQLVFNQSDPGLISQLNDGFSVTFSADNNPLDIDNTSEIYFSIIKSYPNPFNPSVNISFHLEKATDVKVNIYDIKGNLVAELVQDYLLSGNHSFVWDASDNASGAYIIKMNTETFSISDKVMLIK